jgi:hypothetical protein
METKIIGEGTMESPCPVIFEEQQWESGCLRLLSLPYSSHEKMAVQDVKRI